MEQGALVYVRQITTSMALIPVKIIMGIHIKNLI